MARIKGAMMTRKRRKKTLKLAKGFYGSKSKHFKMAKQQVMKSGNYAFAGQMCIRDRSWPPKRPRNTRSSSSAGLYLWTSLTRCV